ncbi:BolA family transcriptional regulator [Gluconacetobacter johannae]|uniref:BolA family transcriptional regulator n=1 Tax=Gluconacetobacter johannae TaxID=112140 RepID=A0A7W4P3U8_9PROT|nr:BolA family transcriptional regulator [Gluconacetobacter johannae]
MRPNRIRAREKRTLRQEGRSVTQTGQDRAARIGRAIHDRLAPVTLDIVDDSARHAHHAGAREAGKGGETHYNVLVVSTGFEGMGRVQRSRLVHDLLGGEFASGLHALSLTLRTPDEHERMPRG